MVEYLNSLAAYERGKAKLRQLMISDQTTRELYFDILKTMVYELAVHNRSPLLDHIGSVMEKKPPKDSVIMDQFDCLPVLKGLLAMLQGESQASIWEGQLTIAIVSRLFKGYGLRAELYGERLDEFHTLRERLETVRKERFRRDADLREPPRQDESSRDRESFAAARTEEEREERRTRLLAAYQELSDGRENRDKALCARLDELQTQLQKQLREVEAARENLEYSAASEAVMQLVILFNLIHAVAARQKEYPAATANYCEFMEAIEQSLAYLGVTAVRDVQVVFDSARHELEGCARPVRGSVVTRILRPGFVYRGSVLQKAVVTADGGGSTPEMKEMRTALR